MVRTRVKSVISSHCRLNIRRCLICCIAVLITSSLYAFGAPYPLPEMDPGGYPAVNKGCISSKCHAGIEPIRAHDSGMARQIYKKGKSLGDPNGCVVCHGGNPKEEKIAQIAHRGAPEGSPLKTFNRHSASMGINDKTCGPCHKKWVYAAQRSVMQTQIWQL
jgi:hypothetical protein